MIAVYWLDKVAAGKPELVQVLSGLERRFFWAGIGCIAIVLTAGMGRTFTYAYIGEVYGADAEKIRKKMLIIKHIVLFAVFGLGLWWQYSIVFR